MSLVGPNAKSNAATKRWYAGLTCAAALRTRDLRTSALVAAFVDVDSSIRSHERHALSWPPSLHSQTAGGVVTCPPQWLPVLLASSSRHVDSHAPRFNDENLLLKATVDGAAHV